MTDNDYMQLALEQAHLAEQIDEVPVGAVLVQNGKLIASAHNQPISTNDPTAHAEIQLLRKACAKLGNYRLPNTTLYVTLEPCTMCLGAMVNARIELVVFGAYDKKTGVCGSCNDLSNSKCFNHKIKVKGGVLAYECGQLLQQFFKCRR
ncbi:MAG: tRNA adenosine(34) deaminase TadA [Candidatus Thioglobus sp.]|nr:MAG: tRNA adenosine(34) deaminase TadA [Candidatus Thioglobus sp.]KAA0452609.1 MAG: tRNA adenosine(34) deaminase TadA [Candidatus Thioglobus sp.]